MTPQQQPDFRPSRSAPVMSDFARERSYALRRMITLTVLAAMIGGAVYIFWGHRPSAPADIPTIKAETGYKQKPADPGGIDIPHQDVRIYDELENKNPTPPVEHLLPPPETPQPPPPVASQPPAPAAAVPAPVANKAADILASTAPAPKPVPTTVTPAPVPAVAPAPAPTTPPLTTNQVIAETTSAAPPPPASGSFAVQLASVPGQSAAQSMAADLQQKYASLLGDARLTPVRADLGNRGIFYRIQSQSLSADAANHICSALKQANAGCILVRK